MVICYSNNVITILNSLTNNHLKCWDINQINHSNLLDDNMNYLDHLALNATNRKENKLIDRHLINNTYQSNLNQLSQFEINSYVSNQVDANQLDELKKKQKLLFDYGLLLNGLVYSSSQEYIVNDKTLFKQVK